MKKKVVEFLKNKKLAAGVTAMALALVVGSVAVVQQNNEAPEFPSYTDPVMEVSIEEEETPLAAQPQVTTKTSKKTSTKKVTLKKAATKTYTKTLPTTKKTTKATSSTSSATVVTQTTVATAVKEKYTKKSKTKVVNTTVTTTVTTTTTAKANVSNGSKTNTTAVSTSQTTAQKKYTADIEQLAPRADVRVLAAYKKLGFTVEVDPSVSYAGHFDAKTRTIVLQRADDTIYHELGHFVAFIAGNADKSSAFNAIYNQEKANFTGVNKAYATQNSSEYFAESMKDYTVNAAALKASRPQTFAAIESSVAKFTDENINKVLTIYGPLWNK